MIMYHGVGLWFGSSSARFPCSFIQYLAYPSRYASGGAFMWNLYSFRLMADRSGAVALFSIRSTRVLFPCGPGMVWMDEDM
jgi:hypothetical protein